MKFQARVSIDAPKEQVFQWHTRPGALQRLMPPWDQAKVLEQTGGIKDGGITVLQGSLGPIPVTWVAEHKNYVEGEAFTDVQTRGPFKKWEHVHSFEERGENSCDLVDTIELQPPLPLMEGFVKGKLDQLFRYRHSQVKADNELYFRLKYKEPLRIAMTGASGLVGSQLGYLLQTFGHTIIPLKHGRHWDYEKKTFDAAVMEGVDILVHLAGESIGSGRWTKAKKKKIWDSRVVGTQFLAEKVATLKKPPKAVISASAIGYYGSRGDEPLTEESCFGDDFLARLCIQWEKACDPLRDSCRVVHPRIGMVLSPLGGGLGQMLLPFKMGAGGVIGTGSQKMSWIALDDLAAALYFLIVNPLFEGVFNMVAPNTVSNESFTKTLGTVLSRPTILPMPAFAARLAFGEMADALLLSSSNVQPERLQSANFPFRFPSLEGALRHMLGK